MKDFVETPRSGCYVCFMHASEVQILWYKGNIKTVFRHSQYFLMMSLYRIICHVIYPGSSSVNIWSSYYHIPLKEQENCLIRVTHNANINYIFATIMKKSYARRNKSTFQGCFFATWTSLVKFLFIILHYKLLYGGFISWSNKQNSTFSKKRVIWWNIPLWAYVFARNPIDSGYPCSLSHIVFLSRDCDPPTVKRCFERQSIR